MEAGKSWGKTCTVEGIPSPSLPSFLPNGSSLQAKTCLEND
jgi:hypothetical protein